MKDEKICKLVIGALLHDIGKVINIKNETVFDFTNTGYEYLKGTVGIVDDELLEAIRYSNNKMLKDASIDSDNLAYIINVANKISSVSDNDAEEYDIKRPFDSIFNVLNDNKENKYYTPGVLEESAGIKYPIDEKQNMLKADSEKIFETLTNHFKGIKQNDEYIESLLEILEANLSYIPAETRKGEPSDISLYDHVKMTAAYSGCIYKYLQYKNVCDYKACLFTGMASFMNEKAFIVCSLDLSGIQDFIYTITTKNALKTLRARSFYLELMMEHLVDSLLEKENLTRANLVYHGGGHCYIILPNTDNSKRIIDQFIDDTNKWFIKTFGTGLYVAGGYSECSANDLRNKPNGSYSCVFKNISRMISEMKMHKYKAEDIISFNNMQVEDYSRECTVCHRQDRLIKNPDSNECVCNMCNEIKELSGKVLYSDFFTVTEGGTDGMEFPFGYKMSVCDKNIIADLKNTVNKIRIYGKNKRIVGNGSYIKLWAGNYTTGETLEQLAEKSEGIKRIGVLRADVDNLGNAIVAGFNSRENGDKYVCLSRTATLSRQLSLFFKYYINDILKNPEFRVITSEGIRQRNAAIVYSGGDDVFIVGAWDDVIEIAVELRNKFKKYTEASLSISGGIGIFNAAYPIKSIADEVGRMEAKAKNHPGKNSVMFFDGNIYSWDEFIDSVLEEKYIAIKEFFDETPEHGKSFLYNMLMLIRSQQEKINFARFVYLMSRMEPGYDAKSEDKQRYTEFSKKMVEWIQNSDDRKQLESAITIYTYIIRETEEGK